MLWSQNLTQVQLEDLLQKGALQLGHCFKKYLRGKAGQWQKLKHTRLFLDDAAEYELSLVGANNSDDSMGIYYLRNSTHGFSHNGRLSFGSFIHVGDRVIIHQDIIIFDKQPYDKLVQPELSNAIIQSDTMILITGETGSGKGHLAKYIFEKRKHYRPWVHVNLSALAPGLVESEIFGHVKGAFTGAFQDNKGAIKSADQSVLFLDEIDSLSLELQSKLLLFLDDYRFRAVGSQKEEKVNLKIIVASGRHLEQLVDQGKFRKDLYYRLISGFTIELPSLKNNSELIKEYCIKFAKENQVIIDPALLDYYQKQSWPGNYRQLKAHLQRKLAQENLGRHFYFDNHDQMLLKIYQPKLTLEKFDKLPTLVEQKKNYAKLIYQKMLGDLNLTASILQISVKTLRSLIN